MRLLIAFAGLLFALGVGAQTLSPGNRAGSGDNASLTRQNQLLQGGANSQTICAVDPSIPPNAATCVAPVSPASLNINCGWNASQAVTGATAAWVIAAPSIDSRCLLLLTNPAASAVVPTLSGFTDGANVGDALTNTANSIFYISIFRVNGKSGHIIHAGQ